MAAQTKVTEFYRSRKTFCDRQPSKRQKVIHLNAQTHEGPAETKFPPARRKHNVKIITDVPTSFEFATASESEATNDRPSDLSQKPTSLTARATCVTAKKQAKKPHDVFLSGRARKSAKSTKVVGSKPHGSVDIDEQHNKTRNSSPQLAELVTDATDDHETSRTPVKSPQKRMVKACPDHSSKKRSKPETDVQPRSILAVDPSPSRLRSRNRRGGSPKTKLFTKTEDTLPNTVITEKSSSMGNSEEVQAVPLALSCEHDNESMVKAGKEPQLVTQEKKKNTNALQATSKEDPAEKSVLKLKKCNKLSDLQAQLASFKSNVSKLKKSASNLQKSTTSKEKTGEPNVVKPNERKKAPAFERFHALTTPVPPTLSLPYQYKVLSEMFRSMDTVVGMLYNRLETITFNRVKAAVQEMCRRTFEKKNLAQIKSVHPSAYVFRQEKGLKCYDNKTHSSAFQLTLEPVVNDDQGTKDGGQKIPHLSASALLERKTTFHRNLIAIVKQHHKEWLEKQARPMTVPDDKLVRWHPKFPLDEVPDVEESELPEVPVVQSYTTAAAVLDKARGIVSERSEKALEKVVVEQEAAKKNPPNLDDDKKAERAVGCQPKVPPMSSQLKGVPLSLLEKIRAKEASKLQQTMTQPDSDNKKTAMMARLPDLTRILRTYFVTEKKTVVAMDPAVLNLSHSYRTVLSTGEVEAHINLLAELVPDWLTINKARGKIFLKIRKDVDVNTICNRLTRLLKK
ncbi:PREDICTED: DNA replication factor Cdt1-like [Priapulus caudatus]|uniref:DNA replication factor Cdt1-like n=1 Tax=Priapulus caudatus TaxID=37621 RepID=A0ABM1DQF7_PRICU|nr:PREDICTED: DNA replication factor Cdt1-like [Priapulus caudatus]